MGRMLRRREYMGTTREFGNSREMVEELHRENPEMPKLGWGWMSQYSTKICSCKKWFSSTQHYIRDINLLNLHGFGTLVWKGWRDRGVTKVGGWAESSHNEYRLATLILPRHSPPLKRIRTIEPHFATSNQHSLEPQWQYSWSTEARLFLD